MFSMEQDEYRKEKIQWESVQYTDNLQCIDLIESTVKKSVFKVLDEECMVKGTEQSLIRKMHDQLQNSQYYGRPKNPKTAGTKFIIKHYAGEVEYEAQAFIDKNRDAVNEQISKILGESKSELITSLFTEIAP